MATPAVCRSCKAPVVWVETESTATRAGRRMPVDADPAAPTKALVVLGANLIFTGARSGDGSWIVRYVRNGDGRYRSHFATCPQAARHRR